MSIGDLQDDRKSNHDGSAGEASLVSAAAVAKEGADLAPAGAGAGLLDRVLEGTAAEPGGGTLEDFLAEADPAKALEWWLGRQRLTSRRTSIEQVRRLLNRDIARLDQVLARQVNAILHHPRFQQLEASWRGLSYLVDQTTRAKEVAEREGADLPIRVQILSVTKGELARDVEKAAEFDRSQLFQKIYEEGFGLAGGEPVGVLIGDYEFSNQPQDLDLLTKITEVAAAAFCPFVSAAAPRMLEFDSFQTLERPVDLAPIFRQLHYLQWRSLRDRDDARFTGLVLPRVLMRLPYDDDGSRAHGFRFREEIERPDRSGYLWGNAAYAFGAVLVRAFGNSRWFADIRGAERDAESGGLVSGLPVHSFSTDRRGVALKSSTEVDLTPFQEKELSTLGFVPLSRAHDTEFCVFHNNASLHKPKEYDDKTASANSRISAMLQYVLCASRFAHYLKVLARNKIGVLQSGKELESILNDWIRQYVAADERASPATKARFPLLDARVEVDETPGSPGTYRMVMHLLPHFQLDGLSASLRLITRLSSDPRR